MKTVKHQKLTTVPFVEGGNCNQILMQLTKTARKVLFNIAGNVVITNKVETIVPFVQPAADGTTLFPYLLMLAGKITFYGTRKDKGKGIKIQNLPVWVLWLEQYILNGGVGPVVTDGGMQSAGFVPGTYPISINFAVNFFDPQTPQTQHPITYFYPAQYNNQPYWQITGGTLFQAGFLGNSDGVALTGDTITNSSLSYNNLSNTLSITSTVVLVPDLKLPMNQMTADIAYEYNAQFGVNQAQFNNIALSDLEVQQYIHMITANLAMANDEGTAKTMAGVNILGSSQNGIVETDEGTDQLTYAYLVNLIASDYDEFMVSVSAWPMGLVSIDEYGRNWAEWQKKTFLAPNAAQHIINSNGTPANGGTNFYIIHKTANLGMAMKNSVNTFPKFAGQ